MGVRIDVTNKIGCNNERQIDMYDKIGPCTQNKDIMLGLVVNITIGRAYVIFS